jgi:hypothetical protein
MVFFSAQFTAAPFTNPDIMCIRHGKTSIAFWDDSGGDIWRFSSNKGGIKNVLTYFPFDVISLMSGLCKGAVLRGKVKVYAGFSMNFIMAIVSPLRKAAFKYLRIVLAQGYLIFAAYFGGQNE